MATYTKQYVMTASPVQLSSLTYLTPAGNAVALSDFHILNVDILGKSSNTGHIFLGPSSVTNVPANAGVDIAPGTAWSSGPDVQRATNLGELYIVGTAADIAYIVVTQ